MKQVLKWFKLEDGRKAGKWCGYDANVIEVEDGFIFEMPNLPRHPDGYRAKFVQGPLMDSYDL